LLCSLLLVLLGILGRGRLLDLLCSSFLGRSLLGPATDFFVSCLVLDEVRNLLDLKFGTEIFCFGSLGLYHFQDLESRLVSEIVEFLQGRVPP